MRESEQELLRKSYTQGVHFNGFNFTHNCGQDVIRR